MDCGGRITTTIGRVAEFESSVTHEELNFFIKKRVLAEGSRMASLRILLEMI